MAHLQRVIADTALVRGYITTGANFTAIDQKTFVSVNGFDGGTWFPSSSLEIAGAGVVVAGLWTMTGGAVNVVTSANKPILFNKGDAGDYFGFDPAHPGASPTIRSGFYDYHSSVAQVVSWFGSVFPLYTGARFYVPLAVYSGAPQIDSVDVTFAVGEAHANVPQYLPRMRIIAVDEVGTATPLHSKDANTDSDGFQFFPTPVSGAAYYSGGAFQTWSYVCNVALPVDSSTYLYYAEFIEESGTDTWTTTANKYRSAVANFSLVTVYDGRY